MPIEDETNLRLSKADEYRHLEYAPYDIIGCAIDITDDNGIINGTYMFYPLAGEVNANTILKVKSWQEKIKNPMFKLEDIIDALQHRKGYVEDSKGNKWELDSLTCRSNRKKNLLEDKISKSFLKGLTPRNKGNFQTDPNNLSGYSLFDTQYVTHFIAFTSNGLDYLLELYYKMKPITTSTKEEIYNLQKNKKFIDMYIE